MTTSCQRAWCARGQALPAVPGGAVFAALAGLVAIHAAIFLPLIPATGKGLGDDYSLHLPSLLAGYFYSLTNGPFSVPWFSPAKCGGVPFLADLNVAYYSVPQALSFVVDPLAAIRITFVGFAGLGAAGAYLLARRRFELSIEAALTAAALFLFNGFFAYRMAIGHLTFHPFALAPWFALLLLPTPAGKGLASTLAGAAVATIAAGALGAYEFQAGMVHAIPPVAIATAIILLVHGHLFGHRSRPWLLFAASIVVSLALSADRLVAAVAFLQQFPRDYYRLPGFANPLDEIGVLLRCLFAYPPVAAANDALVNVQLILKRHELEYSVGPVSAVLIVAGVIALIFNPSQSAGTLRKRLVRGLPFLTIVAALLAIPLALNWYGPEWNAFLKSLPILASSSALVRWFALYIPVIALAAALAFDRVIPAGRPRVLGAFIAIGGTILFAATADQSYYRQQAYDASLIRTSWLAVRAAADVPPITDLVFDQGLDGIAIRDSTEAAAQIVFGGSELACYQPMFGYRLEYFPIGSLRPGPVLDQVGPTSLNIKNPACYVFPEENNCAPGDEFTPDQINAAAAFVAYRPYPFAVPLRQRIAGWINVAALAGMLAALVGIGAARLGKALI